jgi:hypothetical protein
MRLGLPACLAIAITSICASCIPFASIDVHISWSNAILLGELEAAEQEVREGVPAGPEGLKPSTPRIQALLDARKARFGALRPWFDQGAMGEGNDARIHVLQGTGADSAKEWEEAQALAKEENRDREALIRAVADARSADGPEELTKIRDALALAIERRVEAGWRIQEPKGAWVQRGPESSGR